MLTQLDAPNFTRSFNLASVVEGICRKAQEIDGTHLFKTPEAEEVKESSAQPLGWREWLTEHFPRAAYHPMPEGGRHARLWEWFESLTPGESKDPRVEVWPRGGAKSSTGELGTVRVGQKLSRRFVLYVSGTQGQANKHVQSVAAKFEQVDMERAVGKYGNSKGWKVDLLRCANGFNVLALGLDAASRGIKLDDFRPDLIIFDDIDEKHDKEEAVQKKIDTISESILPAGSSDCAVLFLQNKIHANSVVAKLCDGSADFLLNREPPAIEPAVIDLEYERVEREDGTYYYKITGGEATWEGQSLAVCEKQLNDWGRAAFEREAQHNTDETDDGLWKSEWIDHNRISRANLPELDRVVVGVDPSGGAGACGIVAKGRAGEGERAHYYTLEDATPDVGTSPGSWADIAIACYVRNEADAFAVETNFGGEMAETILRRAAKDAGVAVRIVTVTASRGKQLRAEPIAELAEKGYEHHVGHWPELEKEKRKWKPGQPSPNRLDADVWANTLLMKPQRRTTDTTHSTSGRAMAMRRR